MTGATELPIARIRKLAGDAEFIAAMRRFYSALDARIADHNPTCLRRGDCCRFDEFGHRLYVTTAEAAFFAGTNDSPLSVTPTGGCPFQRDRICTARQARPMGCRVFFCESAGEGWQEQLTEQGLAELSEVHQRFELPYAYAEWLVALQQLAD